MQGWVADEIWPREIKGDIIERWGHWKDKPEEGHMETQPSWSLTSGL